VYLYILYKILMAMQSVLSPSSCWWGVGVGCLGSSPPLTLVFLRIETVSHLRRCYYA